MAPKMGKEDTDLLVMVDKLMRGEFSILVLYHIMCSYQ